MKNEITVECGNCGKVFVTKDHVSPACPSCGNCGYLEWVEKWW